MKYYCDKLNAIQIDYQICNINLKYAIPVLWILFKSAVSYKTKAFYNCDNECVSMC